MALLFSRARLPDVTPEQWARAQAFFDANTGVMPHALAVAAGIKLSTARAMILGLASDELARMYWLVYHRCEEAPVHERPFEEGFVVLPWTCPECEAPVVDASELTYEIRCVAHGKLEFG